MRIGELARRADCPVETVRYYEKEGLLAAPRRSGSNYRDYGAAHLERLAFIRRCRALDMSLPEIRALLEAIERPSAHCAPVDALLDEHIGHVAARIADLTALKQELDAIRAHCAGRRPASACGIVETLSRPAARLARRSSHVRGAK
ncbi:MAG: Cd(II)/Pb(II)-responsive transcriptional regulator [Burkholderiales bacterium]